VGAVAGLAGRSSARTPLRVEVGLLEAAVTMLVNQASNALVGGVVPRPAGNDHPNIAPYGPVACADTELVLGAGNDGQFLALCAAVQLLPRPEWATNAGRIADRSALHEALAAALSVRTARDWVPVLAAAGVPCAPVQDLAAVQDDPQVVATGLIQQVDHPAGPVRVVGSPFLLDSVRPRVRRAPPLLGQHTVEVLAALGLDDAMVSEVLDAHRG
jgi:crotonobetainyl-CoA:carnitine CoA-transferase CaiB-like acyl-CoA transferase